VNGSGRRAPALVFPQPGSGRARRGQAAGSGCRSRRPLLTPAERFVSDDGCDGARCCGDDHCVRQGGERSAWQRGGARASAQRPSMISATPSPYSATARARLNYSVTGLLRAGAGGRGPAQASDRSTAGSSRAPTAAPGPPEPRAAGSQHRRARAPARRTRRVRS
jgi:hypothetical protein